MLLPDSITLRFSPCREEHLQADQFIPTASILVVFSSRPPLGVREDNGRKEEAMEMKTGCRKGVEAGGGPDTVCGGKWGFTGMCEDFCGGIGHK